MASNLKAHLQQCLSPPALRSYLAELISTFLFVFTAVGSTVSARMLTPDVTSDQSSLMVTGIAQAFGLFAALFIAADVSGGYVNPAVTFAFALGGHITVPTAIFYWMTQLLGSTLACLVVHFISAGQAVPTTKIEIEMTGFGAAILEAVTTFMLVYTVHVACDPRQGGKRGLASTALGSLAVGLVMGACVLATGSLTGASMNPARSFGPAVVSGDYKNQAVYWAGPMVGAAVAALVHQNLVFPSVSSLPESTHGHVETVLV